MLHHTKYCCCLLMESFWRFNVIFKNKISNTKIHNDLCSHLALRQMRYRNGWFSTFVTSYFSLLFRDDEIDVTVSIFFILLLFLNNGLIYLYIIMYTFNFLFLSEVFFFKLWVLLLNQSRNIFMLWSYRHTST